MANSQQLGNILVRLLSADTVWFLPIIWSGAEHPTLCSSHVAKHCMHGNVAALPRVISSKVQEIALDA